MGQMDGQLKHITALAISYPNFYLSQARQIIKNSSLSVSPAPQRAPQVVSSVWEEQAAGGKTCDGPERRTTSAGHWVNSGARGNKESANKHKDDTALCLGQ